MKKREIKFRAWHKEKKRMFRVLGLWPNDDGSCELQALFLDCVSLDISGGRSGVGYDLMQYTGMKDGKKKDIYEMDFVLVYGKIRLVTFAHAFWTRTDLGGYGTWVKEGASWYFKPLYRYGQTIEVLGNYYENPELLEDKRYEEET